MAIGSRWHATHSEDPELAATKQLLETERSAVVEHPLYEHLGDLDAARSFMELHVFAVWDFMSLLKALQQQLTTVSLPWLPPKDPSLSRLVNELVLEEESDIVDEGVMSHFELYLRGMTAAGADRGPIDGFVGRLAAGADVPTALDDPTIPEAVRDFVLGDWAHIASGDLVTVAAIFAFGREGLIPDMFRRLEPIAERDPERLGLFLDYLRRHIELDGEVHMPMAWAMAARLCDGVDENWSRARDAARGALVRRAQLWSAIEERCVELAAA